MFLKIYPVNYVEDRWNWSKRCKRNLEMRETTGTWKARRYRHWGGLWIVTLVGREESREPLIQRNDLKALGKWKRICLPERGCSEFVCLYVKELFYSLRILCSETEQHRLLDLFESRRDLRTYLTHLLYFQNQQRTENTQEGFHCQHHYQNKS